MRTRIWTRAGGRIVMAMALGALLAVVGSVPASAGGRHDDGPRVPPGMVLVESERSFEETWSSLITALNANPNINLIAIVDHGAAAASVGLELDPNRVAVFGNPRLGAPLMQVNRTVGLDLPQKIQVFEHDDDVWVGFNDATYLKVRHRLGDQPTLTTIAGALRGLAGTAADEDVDDDAGRLRWVRRHRGLITETSDADFDTTWQRLLDAIDASPANVAFTVDHQAGATSAELDLPPTRLVVFGNPNLGTPLMAARPTSGIDLPLKILVWEDADGSTKVTTNDIELARRHRLRRSLLGPLVGAVETFMAAATTTTP